MLPGLGKVEVADFVRIRLRGTSDRITLHEIDRLTPEADAEMNAGERRDSMRFAGKAWVRALAEDDLAVGERRILEFEDYDVVILRGADGFFAFNNACPHLHLPFFERRVLAESDESHVPADSPFTDDFGVVCRWHQSCFDLQTGEIREWAAKLQADGTAPGAEILGDVSKNRARLTVYPCRLQDGHLWIALE